jgi:hypothetical protein
MPFMCFPITMQRLPTLSSSPLRAAAGSFSFGLRLIT